MGIIRIQDLPVEVRIGALPEERVSTQTVRVDIEIRAEMQGAVATDSLDATVNYIDVVNAARLAIEGTTCWYFMSWTTTSWISPSRVQLGSKGWKRSTR